MKKEDNYSLITKKEILYQEFNNKLIKEFYSVDKVKKLFNDNMIEMFELDILRIIFNVISIKHGEFLFTLFQNADETLIKFCKTLDVMLKILKNHNLDPSIIIYNLFSDLNQVHINVVSSFYDKYITSSNIEKINNNDVMPELYMLFNYLVDRDVYSLNKGQSTLMKRIENCEQLINLYNDKESYSFNIIKDYKNQKNNSHAYKVKYKEAFLYINYGLTLDRANYIRLYFGQFLDSLESCIEESDREVFETLKAISTISKQVSFSPEDLELMSEYTLKIHKSGEPKPTFIELSNYFKQMYLNVYNNSFFNTTKLEKENSDDTKAKFIKEVDGVPIFDSGTEFLMSVHSITRSESEDYGYTVPSDLYLSSCFKEEWKELMNNTQKGFSTSIIGPSNMGTIGDDHILLGFNGYSDQTIVTMSQGDAFTSKSEFKDYFTDVNQGRMVNFFIPPNKIEDESRYGYNEMFLSDSKLPDYIVCFQNRPEWLEANNQAVAIAKSFGCPLICIDKEKIKSNEIRKINDMENNLFMPDNLNPSLISDILCKYMNLYTSTAGQIYRFNPKQPRYDMVNEINNFILKFDNKINTIEDIKIKSQWLDTLIDAYDDEVRKFKITKKIAPSFGSISTFILNDDKYIDLSKYIVEKRQELNDASNFKK